MSATLHTYRGADIWPAGDNSSGLRWYVRTNGPGWLETTPPMLRADTLEGMRELIRTYRKAGTR